jgi:hypothetical protein
MACVRSPSAGQNCIRAAWCYLVDGSVPKEVTSLAPDIVLRSDLAPFVTRRIRLASIKCLRVGYLQPDLAPFLPHRRKNRRDIFESKLESTVARCVIPERDCKYFLTPLHSEECKEMLPLSYTNIFDVR